MKRAQLITAWQGAGTEADPRRPVAAVDFAFDSWSDVTGQDVPGADPYIVEVICTPEVLPAVKAHASYGEGAVLFEEDV
jgi:hypothetical protein